MLRMLFSSLQSLPATVVAETTPYIDMALAKRLRTWGGYNVMLVLCYCVLRLSMADDSPNESKCSDTYLRPVYSWCRDGSITDQTWFMDNRAEKMSPAQRGNLRGCIYINTLLLI